MDTLQISFRMVALNGVYVRVIVFQFLHKYSRSIYMILTIYRSRTLQGSSFSKGFSRFLGDNQTSSFTVLLFSRKIEDTC